MINDIRTKLLALAAFAALGVSTVSAGGWSNSITSGSYSGYANVPASTCQQMAYTYGGPPVQVINDGPLASFNDTTLDHEDYISGPVAAGNYYIYQYVFQSPANDNAGGTSVTVFNW